MSYDNPFDQPSNSGGGVGRGGFDEDPLASFDSVPAVSFRDAREGALVGLDVREPAGPMFHKNKFGSKDQKDHWPNGDPKLATVFNGKVVHNTAAPSNTVGEERGLWVTKGEQLFKALQGAQREAGARIGAGLGGVVWVKLAELKDTGKGNPLKLYECRYVPHTGGDPLGAAPQGEPVKPAEPAAPAAPADPVRKDPVFPKKGSPDDVPPF